MRRKNMNLKKAPATYFDNPGDSKATTWDHVLKADNVKRLAFSQMDKNGTAVSPPVCDRLWNPGLATHDPVRFTSSALASDTLHVLDVHR